MDHPFDKTLTVLERIFGRGLVVPGEDFNAVKQPDGRVTVSLRRQLAIAPPGAAPPEEGDFEFDSAIVDEEVYDIVVDNPFAFTLKQFIVRNLSEAILGLAILYGGQGEGSTPVIFSSGDLGGAPDTNSYPAIVLNVPAGGVFTFFCNQPVAALGYLQINTGDFEDGGVVYSGLLATFHYTKP